jgi:hypothetical protein
MATVARSSLPCQQVHIHLRYPQTETTQFVDFPRVNNSRAASSQPHSTEQFVAGWRNVQQRPP